MKKINQYNLLLIIYILLLSTIIIYPNWGIIDDHLDISIKNINQLVECNQSLINLGRFPAIYTFEHYILGKICFNPLFFYFINFIYVAIALVFLYLLLIRIFNNKLIYFLLFIFLSPAFIECFYRLAPSEKQLFVLISIFLFLFYKFIKIHKKKYLVFAFIVSFISLFYKEPAFLLYSGFGFVWYLENRYLLKNDNLELYKKQRPKQIFIFFLVSSIVFLIIYKLITINVTTQYNNFFSGQSYLQRIIQFIRIIKNYTFSNPIVMFGIPLSILIRLIYWDKINIHFKKLKTLKFLPFYDGLLVGSVLYTSSILYLGISYHRYLLPAIGFCFIPVLFYISYAFKYQFKKRLNVILSILFVIFLLNSSIVGINNGIQLKVRPYQFQKMLKVLAPELKKDISSLTENEKIDIYLPGYDRGTYVETFTSLGDFLGYNDVEKDRLDFKSMDSLSGNVIYDYYKTQFQQYSLYQSEKLFYPKTGDYLLLYNTNKLPINYSDYLSKNLFSVERVLHEKIYSLTLINAPLYVIFKRIMDKFGYNLKHKEYRKFINSKIYSWSILKVGKNNDTE